MGDDRWRSTTLVNCWNEISDGKKDKAFDLWTSPAAMKVTDISSALIMTDMNRQRDRHSDNTMPVSLEDIFEAKNELTTSPSIEEKATSSTGKAFSKQNNTHILVASPGSPSGTDDSADDRIPTLPPTTDVNTVPDTTPLKLDTPVQRLEGKLCKLHGQGVKKWKQSHEMVVGADGVVKKKYAQKTYWVWDLDLRGDKKLRQPSLKLMMIQRGVDDNQVATGGGSSKFCTSKVGQSLSCEHVAGSNQSKD